MALLAPLAMARTVVQVPLVAKPQVVQVVALMVALPQRAQMVRLKQAAQVALVPLAQVEARVALEQTQALPVL